eukprot:TRINITY_DN9168_c0_g1_i1.p1 TRINITY_DN9168_c0_g1~~TRINITY_DN9168_c0_g1_i1.p1  ORF type:complete len:420 (+),score=62.25 TRINITY_DN9168_c0_g1_i1:23-1282(+)
MCGARMLRSRLHALPRKFQWQGLRHLSVISGNRVVTADGVELHPLWLRERCSGPFSVQWETVQPLGQPSDLCSDLSIRHASIRPGGGGSNPQLKVEFSDGHISVFDAAHLDRETKEFYEVGVQQADLGLPPLELWDGTADVSYVSYDEISRGQPEGVLDLTTRLLSQGHVVVEGVPCVDKHILTFAKMLSGFAGGSVVRPTNWGEVFNVRSIPDGQMKDLAYTADALPPHVDNPYRDPNPGFQMLHALENECSTGLSLAVDGFAVAEAMRAETPELFDILTDVECRWENDGGDRSTALVHFAPMIQTNKNGRIKQIRYSPKSGGYCPVLETMERMTKFFDARRRFAELLNSEARTVYFRLKPGDLWMFNNLRVLHGRTAFDPSEGARFFQGAYCDMDAIHSGYFRSKYAVSSGARQRHQ